MSTSIITMSNFCFGSAKKRSDQPYLTRRETVKSDASSLNEVHAEGHFCCRPLLSKMQERGHLREPKFIVADPNCRLATFFLFREGKICGKSEDISRNGAL